MSYALVDIVEIYKSLSEGIKTNNNAFRVWISCYFFGRIKSFNKDKNLISDQDNNKCSALFMKPYNNDLKLIKALSDEAFSVGMGLDQRSDDRIIIGAYWAISSYYGRYILSSEAKYVEYALDNYLSAVEHIGDESGADLLRNEKINLSNAITLALQSDNKNIDAPVIVKWASSSSFGEILEPFN